MKKLFLLLIVFLISVNFLYAQDFRLGFGFGGSKFSEKTTPDLYTDGKWSSDFTISLPRIFALYSFNERFAAEVRIEAEVELEELQGAVIGMFARYYPHEIIFVQCGVLMHKTTGSAHGLMHNIERTMYLPAAGIGIQPIKAVYVDALYVYGGDNVITHSVPTYSYGKPHDWKLDWMFKIGIGVSFSL